MLILLKTHKNSFHNYHSLYMYHILDNSIITFQLTYMNIMLTLPKTHKLSFSHFHSIAHVHILDQLMSIFQLLPD